jgi:DNA-binding transcriptional regulator YiaG
MTRATVLQEVRQLRCEELYTWRQRRELTMAEAAEMLGVTDRTFSGMIDEIALQAFIDGTEEP